MKSEDLLREQGEVLAAAVRQLGQLPGSRRRRYLVALRRTAANGILVAAREFRDPHTEVALQAQDVGRDFNDLMAETIGPEAIEPRQRELAELAVKAGADGLWASFRGLEALLQVRRLACVEGEELEKAITGAYTALAQSRDFLASAR